MTLPVGHLLLDDSARIVSVSARAAEWLGYEASALEGQPISQIVSGATSLFLSAQVLPAIAEGRRVEEVYLTFSTRTGESLPVVLNAELREEGEARRIECAFLPMRRRRLFERELVAAERALMASARTEHALREEMRLVEERMRHHERLAALGSIAAAVGHEINNPLAYVSANIDLIAERLRQGGVMHPREVTPFIEDVRDGVARIRSVVSNLKSLTRADAGPVEPVDLSRAIHGALKVIEAKVRARASLHLALEEGLFVLGNELRIGQVVQNLIANAADAFAEADARANRITVRTSRGESDMMLVEVFDNGPGMSPEVLSRIFDPFFTTRPAGVGMGLGLSICHGIVTAAGGTISVESAPGRGTSFHVQLRAAPAPELEVLMSSPSREPPFISESAPPGETRSSAPTRRRVLIIDDDENVARIVRRALGAWDSTIETSSVAALARLREDPTFDLVVCDLLMPEMTGQELFEAISRESPSLAGRFMFLTGGACDDESRRFLESCGRPFLGKPFSLTELRRVGEEVGSSNAR